jgi:hypothetical protein
LVSMAWPYRLHAGIKACQSGRDRQILHAIAVAG